MTDQNDQFPHPQSSTVAQTPHGTGVKAGTGAKSENGNHQQQKFHRNMVRKTAGIEQAVKALQGEAATPAERDMLSGSQQVQDQDSAPSTPQMTQAAQQPAKRHPVARFPAQLQNGNPPGDTNNSSPQEPRVDAGGQRDANNIGVNNNGQNNKPTLLGKLPNTRGSVLQDLFVTLVVALISFTAGYSVFTQASFGLIPSICIGSGLFLWLISAHFLITRLRLKALIDGHLKHLSADVDQLKQDFELTDLLAEGHNELSNRQEMIEDVSKSLARKMDQFEAQLGIPATSSLSGNGPGSTNLLLTSQQQAAHIKALHNELDIIRGNLVSFVNYHDQASKKEHLRTRAELELMHLMVKQLAKGETGDQKRFVDQALQVIGGLKKIGPEIRPELSLQQNNQRGRVAQGQLTQKETIPQRSQISGRTEPLASTKLTSGFSASGSSHEDSTASLTGKTKTDKKAAPAQTPVKTETAATTPDLYSQSRFARDPLPVPAAQSTTARGTDKNLTSQDDPSLLSKPVTSPDQSSLADQPLTQNSEPRQVAPQAVGNRGQETAGGQISGQVSSGDTVLNQPGTLAGDRALTASPQSSTDVQESKALTTSSLETSPTGSVSTESGSHGLQNETPQTPTTQSTGQQSSGGFIAPGRDIFALLMDAIENEKIELFMQPIVKLPDRELGFYETFARLRNDVGQILLPEDFFPEARRANLVSLIDNQVILQAVKVISRLNERGKGRTVFCNIALESLRDPDFFAEFIVFLEQNQWLSEQLIFEISQDHYHQCGQYELEKIDRIATLGYRFSMDNVTDLNINFQAMQRMRFRFMKIDAGLFLGGMEDVGAQIHIADMATFLKRNSIELIINHIERESTERQLHELNISYVQGNLYSEAKPIKREILHASKDASFAA